MTRTLHLLDYALKGMAGHDFNYEMSLITACRTLGIPCRLHVCKKLDEAIRAPLDGIRTFSSFWEDYVESRDPQTLVQRLNAFNIEFMGDLVPLSPEITQDSVIFVQSIRMDRLIGLKLWLAAFPAERAPSAVIFLRYDLSNDPMFLAHLPEFQKMGPRVRFCTDTPDLQQAFARIGCRVDVVPIPHCTLGDVAPPPDMHPVVEDFLHRPGGPLLGFFGPAREGKGFPLLPEIIEHVAELKPEARILIQSPKMDQGRLVDRAAAVIETFAKLQAIGETRDNVLWLDGPVDDHLYRYLMSCTDIVLLPYTHAQYRTSSSGIFSEAVAAGKVTVLPADTWMERQAQQHDTASVVFRGNRAADVALAIAKALARYDDLAARAADVAPAWAAHHSPETFVRYLLQGP